MSRRIVACAALLALVVSLSACACPGVSRGGDGGSGADGASGSTASSGTTTSGTVCVPVKCARNSDCTACYRSEAERNMARMADDWPSGGCCCDCPVPVEKKREPKDCCAKK